MPVYRETLEEERCAECGEGTEGHEHEALHIYGACHVEIRAPLHVRYHEGLLWLNCAECGEHVMAVAVARKP